MKDVTKEELIEILKEELKMKCDNCNFMVSKEKHYLHHSWIDTWMEWNSSIRNNFIKGIIGIFLLGIFILIGLGFITWIKIKTGIGK